MLACDNTRILLITSLPGTSPAQLISWSDVHGEIVAFIWCVKLIIILKELIIERSVSGPDFI